MAALVLVVCMLLRVRFTFGICDSTLYSDTVRKILLLQDKFTVYEGSFECLLNKSYPQANPSGIYCSTIFFDPAVRDYESTIHYSYFMRSSNALVFPGCTPPKSVYFSFVSYLMVRNLYQGWKVHYPQPIFASLGAALNHLIINTTSQDPWDSLMTLIQTADATTYQYIYDLLINNTVSKIPETEINLQSLPIDFLNFTSYGYDSGNTTMLDEDYDTGTLVMRVTLPDDRKEYNEYINTSQPIFMLAPKNVNSSPYNTSVPIKPYAPYIRDTYSKNNFNESAVYNKTLHEFKDKIIDWLTANYGNISNNYNLSLNLVSDTPIGLIFDDCDNELDCYGFRCIENVAWCLGDNRDTWYGNPYNIIINEDSNIYYMVIVGVMHSNEAIKQTTYTNIAYYDHENEPLENYDNPVINMREYNGSALIWNKYVNANISDDLLENLFVVQLGLSQNCIMIEDGLADNLCLNQDDEGTNYYGNVNERIYLNPITKTRPNLDDLVISRFLKFQVINNTAYN